MRRQWFVLASIIIVAVAVDGTGWYRAHRRELAIQEIERLGGFVKTKNRFPVFDYIADLGGVKFDGSPVRVAFDRNKIIDSDLENLQYLTTLDQVAVTRCGITDERLKHLKGLPRLRKLYLKNNNVTEKGLIPLRRTLSCSISWK